MDNIEYFDLPQEYAKLHDRYTELFKTHVDYMERTKMLMGSTHSQMSSASDRLDVNRSRLHPMYRSSGPVSYGFASLETSQMLDTETICSPNGSSNDSGSGPPSLQNEFDNIQTVERSAETDALQQTHQATSPQTELSPVMPPIATSLAGRTTTKTEKRSANTLYQELSFQDNEESEENEVTGECLVECVLCLCCESFGTDCLCVTKIFVHSRFDSICLRRKLGSSRRICVFRYVCLLGLLIFGREFNSRHRMIELCSNGIA